MSNRRRIKVGKERFEAANRERHALIAAGFRRPLTSYEAARFMWVTELTDAYLSQLAEPGLRAMKRRVGRILSESRRTIARTTTLLNAVSEPSPSRDTL